MDEGKTFKCPDCGKEFLQENSLLQHKNDAHSSQTTPKKPFRIGKILPYIIGVIILAGVGYVIYWSITGLSISSSIGQIGSFNLTSSFVPYRGNISAKINVIEFGDYQCPVCERFFSQTEPQVKQNYVDNGKVKFYFMDFAFLGPDSQTLAQGAWCANDQGKYYDFHDYIYSHQGQESTGWGTPAKTKAMASNIPGLDTQQFGSCLDTGKYQSRVQQLTQLGKNSGVTGTPTFFIGNDQIGYLSVVGAQSFSLFQQDIDSQLAKV